MRRGALLFSLLMILVLAVTAQAAIDVTCFSKEYSRRKGTPVTTSDTFNTAYTGPGTLKTRTFKRFCGIL